MVATLETLVADIKKHELPAGRKLVEFLRGDLLPHAHGEELSSDEHYSTKASLWSTTPAKSVAADSGRRAH